MRNVKRYWKSFNWQKIWCLLQKSKFVVCFIEQEEPKNEKADEWNCECEDGFWHLCDDTENILYFISRINKYLN